MTKCDKKKQCKYYDEHSATCNKYGGAEYCGRYYKKYPAQMPKVISDIAEDIRK
jgi:hypothetical protein